MKCVLSCVLSLMLLAEAQRTATVTLTDSRTVTSTVHLSTNVSSRFKLRNLRWSFLINFYLKLACAQLVNVTGRCRQRRGFPAEEPVILVVDYHEHNWFNPQPFWQFIPTKTLRCHFNMNNFHIRPLMCDFEFQRRSHAFGDTLRLVAPSSDKFPSRES